MESVARKHTAAFESAIAGPSSASAGLPARVSRVRAVHAALCRPVDVAFLAAFRVLFGTTMAFSMMRFIAYGWIDDFWVKPTFHFKYWGFSWVEPLSASHMHTLFWVLAALGVMVATGLLFRLASALFVAGFLYLQLIDVTTYLNHYYLGVLIGILLAASPAGSAYSVDAWLLHRRGRPAQRTVPAFWLYLLRFQIGVVYTFAGLAKANADWLVHAQPLRIWLGSRTGLPVVGPLFALPYAPLFMSWAGFLFDSFILWFLLVRRVRLAAFVVVIGFHAMTRYMFPIGMFPVIMVTSALVFFPPDWPRKLLAVAGRVTKLDRLAMRWQTKTSPIADQPAPVSRTMLALAGAYCLIQLAVPLRFLAYGDNVRWHEQGMRFSWRVMVREKNGSITFIVRSRSTGRTWHVSPRTFLTPLQEREMSGQPDLVLQLAHVIHDDFERRGHGDVEVRVDALVSLNGRRLAPMIDPEVDLARVTDGLARARWILPSPTDPPPHIRPI